MSSETTSAPTPTSAEQFVDDLNRTGGTNPLLALAAMGQSVWYDQLGRSLIRDGELARLVREDGLRGVTSNPTIFEKSIGGSADYAGDLGRLAKEGKSISEIYEGLVVDDIGKAADVLRPVYDATSGADGFVSLEVDPLLAHDTASTIAEAKRLFTTLDRPNVMIKVPATPEGLPAVEELIAAGLNINITLIFSQKVYGEVAEAYIRGLERRRKLGLPVNQIASVASFFVSRIDTAADKLIQARLQQSTDPARSDPKMKSRLEALLGKVAIANAKMAYAAYKEIFEGKRFAELRAAGARPQRQLWASTGTKNPAYSDVLYVEQLIGPDTVDTIPPATLNAFRDHGRVARTLDKDVEQARHTLEELRDVGISLDAITEQLTTEGVESFSESFRKLTAVIETRRKEQLGK